MAAQAVLEDQQLPSLKLVEVEVLSEKILTI
jgi:hypothetical protein